MVRKNIDITNSLINGAIDLILTTDNDNFWTENVIKQRIKFETGKFDVELEQLNFSYLKINYIHKQFPVYLAHKITTHKNPRLNFGYFCSRYRYLNIVIWSNVCCFIKS